IDVHINMNITPGIDDKIVDLSVLSKDLCGALPAIAYVWMSEDNFVELVLPFYMSSKNTQTQIISLHFLPGYWPISILLNQYTRALSHSSEYPQMSTSTHKNDLFHRLIFLAFFVIAASVITQKLPGYIYIQILLHTTDSSSPLPTFHSTTSPRKGQWILSSGAEELAEEEIRIIQ
ncbi:hypothetical protein STEG23_033450, partial [Scotinomys teguina]